VIFKGETELKPGTQRPTFDLVVAACGYESRARFLLEHEGIRGSKNYALEFGDRRELAFDANYQFFRSAGVVCTGVSDDGVSAWMAQAVARVSKPRADGIVRVFVDISSQSRARLAGIVEGLELAGKSCCVEVVFGYALGAYSAPNESIVPNLSIGPVSPRFAGWSLHPELPCALVVGLGYEEQRAMGAVEFLEPTDVWALQPRSQIDEYTDALERANAELLTSISGRHHVAYAVEDPNHTFAILNSLSLHLAGRANVVLLPSGPKILALLSLLTALVQRDIAVWRVTAGMAEVPADRRASGTNIFVEAEFSPVRAEVGA